MKYDHDKGRYSEDWEEDLERDRPPPRPAPGKVTLAQNIPVQRKARVDGRPKQEAEPIASFGFVQAYRGEIKPTDSVAFPDEHPVSWLSATADQACRDAFNFEFKPVQRAATSAAESDTDVVHAAAARGLDAPGQQLPYFDQIQKAFGHHDVSHVQAHVGGAAAEASTAMGAEAYAAGEHVAFASSPDLHTAAHEAAHVVQQKGGVQLKGGVGEAGDSYERHADAVADKVVAGESAVALLDQMAGGVSSSTSTVQMKKVEGPGDKPDDSKEGGDEPEIVEKHDAGWPVFAASGKPYLIADRGGQHGFWAVRSWIKADPELNEVYDRRSGATALSAPSRAREILSAMGTANLDYAAKNLTFRFRKHVQREFFAVGVEGAHAIGLPAGREVLVERDLDDGLKATVALDDPSIAPGSKHTLTANELQRTIEGARSLTGLAVDANGAAFLAQQWAGPGTLLVGNGVVTFPLLRGFCRTLFGMEAYDRWVGEQKAPRKRPAEGKAPKLKLENFYHQPIPGRLTHYADFIESGEAARFEVVVDWPGNFPDPEEFDAPPLVEPSKFGTVALLKCKWQFERVPGFVGRMMRQAVGNAGAPGAGGGAPSASAVPGMAAGPTSTNASGPTQSATGGIANPVPANGAAALLGGGATQTTDTAEVFHRFALQPGESSATFRVTCSARFDEYFEPETFTRDVVVMSSSALMAKLQSEALDLGGPDVDRSKGSWTGNARPGFVASPAAEKGGDVADPMAANRKEQRERLEALGEYLRASDEMRDKPAAAEAIASIDAELARQRRTEELLAKDKARGWQTFQLRGTYLSRTEGLPSGPLDLHGTVRVEARYDRYAGDGPSTVQRIRDDKYVVQIRDLSRRFEQEDFTFEGEADTFDEALKAAFEDLAVAYPKGLVSIEAEQIRGEALRQTDGSAGPQAALGPSTGKVIGFRLNTVTTWKKVKEKVWDPVAQVAVNLGAIALMTLVPATSAIMAPALIAYNSAPAIDNIKSQMDRGTLTLGKFAMSTGEIALNILPLVSRAKPFTAGWFMVETANWGGQFALMAGNAVEMAKELQAKQVSALAEEYMALLELKKNALPTDGPKIAEMEEEIRRKAEALNGEVYRQFDGLVASNFIQMVAGTVIHNASSKVHTAIVEHLNWALRNPGTTTLTHAPANDATPPPATDSVSGPAKGPASGDDGAPHHRPATDKTAPNTPNSPTRSLGHEDGGDADGVDTQKPRGHDANKTHSTQDRGSGYVETVLSLAGLHQIRPGYWQGNETVIRRLVANKRALHFVEEVGANGETHWSVTTGGKKHTIEVGDETRTRQERKPFSEEGRRENQKALAKGEPGYNAVVGYVDKHTTGVAIIQRLMRGDRTALAEIGYEASESFDPSTREWGLGKFASGKYVIVAGEHGAVDWTAVAGVKPAGHSHPLDAFRIEVHAGKRLDFRQLASNPSEDTEYVMSSPEDIQLIAKSKVDRHSLALPYEHLGGTEITLASATPSGRPQLVLLLEDAREIRPGPDGATRYRVRATAMAAAAHGDTPIWHATIDAVFPANAKPRLEFNSSVPDIEIRSDSATGAKTKSGRRRLGSDDALGSGPERAAMRPRDDAQSVGAVVPRQPRTAREILADDPGRTSDQLPEGWRDRDDAELLEQHGLSLDRHELENRDSLRNALARGAKEDVQGAYKAKLTEVEGERAATKFMLEHEPDAELYQGFAVGTGYDQIWVRRGPNGRIREYIIVEAKGPGAVLLRDGRKGVQMSNEWVTRTAERMRAQGIPLGDEILRALERSDVAVTGRVIEADGAGGGIERSLPEEISHYTRHGRATDEP